MSGVTQHWLSKSQITVDKGTSTGLTTGNVSVRKLSHGYSDSKGQTQFMYYQRIIVNFKKLPFGNKFFLWIFLLIFHKKELTWLCIRDSSHEFTWLLMESWGQSAISIQIKPTTTTQHLTSTQQKWCTIQITKQLKILILIETVIIVLQQLEW